MLEGYVASPFVDTNESLTIFCIVFSVLYIAFHLILKATLEVEFYFFLHLTDERIEAKKALLTHPKTLRC